MYFIGIDPGAKGALCVLDPSNRHPQFIDLVPDDLAIDVIGNIWDLLDFSTDVHVTLEHVHSLPGTSAKSNFTFGGMFWRIRTIIECMGFDIELVQPKAWQKAVAAPTRKFLGKEMELKQAVADLAEGYYPTAALHGPRGGLKDGRSDALMIAHYALITHGNDYGIQTNNERST